MAVNHLQRANDLIELKKFDLAEREVRRALARNPDDGDAYYLLAWILWKSGKTKSAFKLAKKAIQYAPEDAFVHSLLASLLDETRQRKKGEVHHQKAIQLSPNTADFYVRYAYHLYWGFPLNLTFIVPHTPVWHAWKKAMTLLEEALKLNPRHAGAYRVRALWLGKIHRISEAHQDAIMALEIEPNRPASHEVLGDIYLAEFQPSEAFSAYREALRLNPDDKQLKSKLVHTLEARIPWIGVLWHISRGQPAGWRGGLVGSLVLLLLFLFVLLEWYILVVVYPPFLLFLFFLMNTLGEYLLTQAILKGWIKI